MQPRRSCRSTMEMLDSGPEFLPPEHGRLSEPRDWSMALGSDNGGGGGLNGYRKGQALELDGEWFGDAVPPQESPAMALLLSIANAAAEAVPGLARTPLPCEPGHSHPSRNRAWRDRRLVFSSHSGSTGRSSTLSSPSRPGELYRLSWYRRPLRTPPPPPPPPMSGDALTFSRRGLTSFPLLNAGGDSDRSTAATPIVTPTTEGYKHDEEEEEAGKEKEEDKAEVDTLEISASSTPPARSSFDGGPVVAPLSLTVEAAPTPDRPTLPVAGETSELGAAVPAAPTGNAPTAPVGSTDNTVSPNGDVDISGSDSPTETVRELKAEVERLKREMAAMAAAATNMGVSHGAHASSNGAPKSPRAAPTGVIPWQWTSFDSALRGSGLANGQGPGPKTSAPAAADAALVHATRPKSVRLRPDDSWMQRRFSGGPGVNASCKTRSPASSSDKNDGMQTRVRSSMLPQSPASSSDGERGSAGGGTPPRGSSHDHEDGSRHPVTLEISPPRNRQSSVGLGPSPASGDKTVGGSNGGDGNTGGVESDSIAARLLDADEEGSDAGGGGSSSRSQGSKEGSGHRDITVRPFPVFFPPGGASEGARRSGEGVSGAGDSTTTLATELAAAAAGTVGGGRTGGDATEEGPKIRGGGFRRRRSSCEDDAQLWRWVLAQRTENATVRQAIMSHGLPPNSRRKIWTAWAAVARPNNSSAVFDRRKETKLGSVENIISHDVQRTKIQHPLFTGQAPQGIPILKQVLLQCAELGAVKDAGYIQGMNFLAGFLILTFAESVVSEREGIMANNAQKRLGGEGGGNATQAAASRVGQGVDAQERPRGQDVFADTVLTAEEMEIVETECVQVMQGLVALQGGVLSRDLCGLHANTELVEDLFSRHCPSVMDHLRSLNLELIVLTPRWFICIYAASIASQSVVARIWDLFLWHGRRGPAVLVWLALGVLHGCRRRLFESETLPTAVTAIRRYVEGCKSFADLVRQAPVGLNQVVAAWEEHRNNRRIVALDGKGPMPDTVVGGLVQEMTGEVMISLPPPPDLCTSPRASMDRGYGGGSASVSGVRGHFPATPGRLPTPLTSPRSPFPQWAANIFRSSTGGMGDPDAPAAVERDRENHRDSGRDNFGRHGSPRGDMTPSKWGEGGSRTYRRASSHSSWW